MNEERKYAIENARKWFSVVEDRLQNATRNLIDRRKSFEQFLKNGAIKLDKTTLKMTPDEAVLWLLNDLVYLMPNFCFPEAARAIAELRKTNGNPVPNPAPAPQKSKILVRWKRGADGYVESHDGRFAIDRMDLRGRIPPNMRALDYCYQLTDKKTGKVLVSNCPTQVEAKLAADKVAAGEKA